MNNPQAQAGAFPVEELGEFLPTFLDGLLNEGLTQPLQRFAEGRSGPVAQAAQAWREQLMKSTGPVVALRDSHPGFPEPVNDLLIEGMEVGAIDYVVRDMITLLADTTPDTAGRRLFRLLAEYRARPKRTSICIGCVQRDFARMFRRALVEDAVEVRLARVNEFLEQRFAGPYVVSFRQPTRDEVHEAMLKLLQQGGEIAPGINCKPGKRPGGYILRQGEQMLLVSIEP